MVICLEDIEILWILLYHLGLHASPINLCIHLPGKKELFRRGIYTRVYSSGQ